MRFKDLKVGQRLIAGPNCVYCLTAGREYRVTLVTLDDEGVDFCIQCNEGPHHLDCWNFSDGDFSIAPEGSPFEQSVRAYIDQELSR